MSHNSQGVLTEEAAALAPPSGPWVWDGGGELGGKTCTGGLVCTEREASNVPGMSILGGREEGHFVRR